MTPGTEPSTQVPPATPDGAAAGTALPDYGGGWIGGILPALTAGEAPIGAPAWVADARRHVLLLVDGLGWELYHRFAAHLPALDGCAASRITSVVPPTTASALPSLTTGLTPGQHGMLGDRMRVGGRVLNVLQWTAAGGDPPDPAQVQPHQPFAGGGVTVVSHAKFAGSGFSAAHLRGAPYRGYETADDLVAEVGRCLDAGAGVVYAYLPDLDRAAHEHGLAHDVFGEMLALTDRVVAGIRVLLPDDAALLVTADHGHVTTDPRERVDLRPLRPLVAAMAGSTRLRYLHARAGAVAELRAAAAELVGARAWVLGRDDVLSAGWLGPSTRPVVAGRLGDVVLAARGTATLVDPSDRRQAELVTMHGSVTAAEMYVPLFAVRG